MTHEKVWLSMGKACWARDSKRGANRATNHRFTNVLTNGCPGNGSDIRLMQCWSTHIHTRTHFLFHSFSPLPAFHPMTSILFKYRAASPPSSQGHAVLGYLVIPKWHLTLVVPLQWWPTPRWMWWVTKKPILGQVRKIFPDQCVTIFWWLLPSVGGNNEHSLVNSLGEILHSQLCTVT